MPNVTDRPILTVRIHAGLNADSFLAGLLAVTGATKFMSAQDFLESKFPGTASKLFFESVSVQHIAGFACRFETPHEHAHRTPADIEAIYTKSNLSEAARDLAKQIWLTVSAAEARVHGVTIDKVHFHEVGRMSNILAVGLIAELFAAMNPAQFVVSPVPMGDGVVKCAHGLVPNPAPATLAMMDGVAVRSYTGTGEAVTPTGLAVILGLGATFGGWPEMTVTKHVTTFVAGKFFENTANGTIFALGSAL
ncbi:MAG: DUF111 family protein [Sutterellaceae bacterium]|nr:DUF111 family protein [Sutterellaceae bacterium]